MIPDLTQAEEGTPAADEWEILVALIETYENQHYRISSADPVEAIKFRSLLSKVA